MNSVLCLTISKDVYKKLLYGQSIIDLFHEDIDLVDPIDSLNKLSTHVDGIDSDVRVISLCFQSNDIKSAISIIDKKLNKFMTSKQLPYFSLLIFNNEKTTLLPFGMFIRASNYSHLNAINEIMN